MSGGSAPKLVPTSTAAGALGLQAHTLREWADRGGVRCAVIDEDGHRRWDLDDLRARVVAYLEHAAASRTSLTSRRRDGQPCDRAGARTARPRPRAASTTLSEWAEVGFVVPPWLTTGDTGDGTLTTWAASFFAGVDAHRS